MKSKIIIVWIFFLLLPPNIITFVSSYEVSLNNIIYVDDDNTEGPWDGTLDHPYQYIQDGIDAADNGDTVFVYSGIYKKKNYIDITINKSIKLIGENKNTTIVDGFRQEYGIRIFSDSVFISGFTIKNAAYSGIGVFSDLNTISENNISVNLYSGILCSSSNNNKIINNTLCLNEEGILLIDADTNKIESNVILNNRRYGIVIGSRCSDNSISGNMISNNEVGIILTAFGFPIGSNNKNSILHNIISDNDEGLYLLLTQFIKINYNNFINNMVHANFSSSYFCSWESNYWDDWDSLYPRPIYGDVLFFYLTLFLSIKMNQDLWISIPWVQFHLKPATEPYEISY